MNTILRQLLYISILGSVLLLHSCSDDTDNTPTTLTQEQLVANQGSALIQDWYSLYLELDKDLEDFRPNPTSRALGYIGIAAYEAALPGMPEYQSIQHTVPAYNLSGINPYNELYWSGAIDNGIFWEAVLNHTYYRMFNFFLFAMDEDQVLAVENLYQSEADRLSTLLGTQSYTLAINRAEEIANAVIDYSETDAQGSQQVHEVEPEGYTPPVGTGKWRPTGPDFSNACHPFWHRVRIFLSDNKNMEVLPHAPYSDDVNSEFYKQAKEVDDAIQNLSHDDRWIAEFWSDDIVGITFSPPARQVAIANQLLSNEGTDMEKALRMYLRLGIALNDASVVCWGAKYEYNLERPVDYIRRLINPDFTPILGDAVGVTGLNPNFPAYPSGHSTFAGAGAEVFKMYFDNMLPFTDRCHEGNPLFLSDPRSYSTFDDLAAENAYSRIPLGVHFRMDCDEGLRLGQLVGENSTSFNLRR